MSKYSELLKDPHWQEKRLRILDRDNFTCTNCPKGKSTGTTLHVHHLLYVHGRKPWEYEDFELVTLCDGCHELMPRAAALLIGRILMRGGKDAHGCSPLAALLTLMTGKPESMGDMFFELGDVLRRIQSNETD